MSNKEFVARIFLSLAYGIFCICAFISVVWIVDNHKVTAEPQPPSWEDLEVRLTRLLNEQDDAEVRWNIHKFMLDPQNEKSIEVVRWHILKWYVSERVKMRALEQKYYNPAKEPRGLKSAK